MAVVELDQIVTVGTTLLERGHGNEAVAAGAIVNQQRLVPFAAKLVGQDAQCRIRARTRRERRNDADGPCRE